MNGCMGLFWHLICLSTACKQRPELISGLFYMSDADKHKLRSLIEPRIAALEADLARARAEVFRIEKDLEFTRQMAAATLVEVAPASSGGGGNKPTMSLTDVRPYSEMTIVDAAVQFLLGCDGPRTTHAIADALEKGGAQFLSEFPPRAVSHLLAKRAKAVGDVAAAGFSKWVHRDRISPRKLKKLRERQAGTGGRPLREHARLTSEGMERARASGRHVGRIPKLNAEKVALIKRMRADGLSQGKACQAVGISLATFQTYKKQIEAWQEGMPWPPQDTTETQASKPSLRLVGGDE